MTLGETAERCTACGRILPKVGYHDCRVTGVMQYKGRPSAPAKLREVPA
jgi:hypothetical protein